MSHKDEAKEAENFHQRLEKGEVIDEGLALKSSLTNDSWQDLNRRYTPLPFTKYVEESEKTPTLICQLIPHLSIPLKIPTVSLCHLLSSKHLLSNLFLTRNQLLLGQFSYSFSCPKAADFAAYFSISSSITPPAFLVLLPQLVLD